MSYLTYMYGKSNTQCRYDYCEYVKANSHVCYIEIQLLVICCRSLIPRNKVLDRTLHLLKLFLIEWTSCWYRKEAICNVLKLGRFHVLIECPLLFTSCQSYPEQSLKEVYVWTWSNIAETRGTILHAKQKVQFHVERNIESTSDYSVREQSLTNKFHWTYCKVLNSLYCSLKL